MAAAIFTTVKAYRREPNRTVGLRKTLFGTIVVDGSIGSAAGDIPASVFGLTVIEEVSSAVKSDNSLIVVLAPAYSATVASSSVIGKAAATAATANIPSGTYQLTVKGY